MITILLEPRLCSPRFGPRLRICVEFHDDARADGVTCMKVTTHEACLTIIIIIQ